MTTEDGALHLDPWEVDAREADAAARAGGIMRRLAVRVVILDADARVLLLGVRDPDDGQVVWVSPGGGLVHGESLEAAARRELREELGIRAIVPLVGPVWRRHHRFTWDGILFDQRELFFVARVADGVDRAAIRPPGREGTYFVGARWLTVDEIAASRDTFTPRRLPELLPALIRGEVASEPIDTGI